MAAYACRLPPEAPAWHPLPGCRGPRSGVGNPAVTSTTSPCLLFCCQLPSSLHFFTGTWLMLGARTSDQRRKYIRGEGTPYRRQTEPIPWNFSYHSCQSMRHLSLFECALWARYMIILPRQTICSKIWPSKKSPSNCTKYRYNDCFFFKVIETTQRSEL